MTFDLFKSLANKFKEAMQVQFIGTGEPLLNTDLFSMVDYAKKKRFETCVVTNGVLVDQYFYEILRAPIDTFIISINGHTGEEFHRMTGLSPKIWETIRNHAVEIANNPNRRFNFTLSFIIDKTNVKDIQEMIDFGAKLGADTVLLVNFLPSKVRGFTPEERTVFIEDFNPIEAKTSLRVPDGVTVTLPRSIDRKRPAKVCREFFRLIRVDGEGNVGGCPRQLLSLEQNGNFDDPDVWNNKYFRNMRRNFLHDNLELPESCRWCFSNSPHEQIVLRG